MAYESAELAKISINMYLVASVTVTNTLAEICENVGANWEDIAPTLKSDKRIGPYAYLKPGLGISGGNLERDLNSIISIGSRFGTNTQAIQAFINTSIYTKNWLSKTFKKMKLKESKLSKVAVLGLAYKENTNSTKNSPALLFISKLQKYSVSAHDPVALVNNALTFVQEATVDNCLRDADVLVISTPWSEYKKLNPKKIKTLMRGRIIIDPYQIVNSDMARQYGFTCYSLGK